MVRTIVLSKDNIDIHLSEIIQMNDDFLIDIGAEKERSDEEKKSIVSHMVNAYPNTQMLIALAENDNPVGFVYFNFGTGYSCGGNYVWLNSIFVKPSFRRRKVGRALLSKVIEIANENQARLLISSRDMGNNASSKLFEKAGFSQSENVWMVRQL